MVGNPGGTSPSLSNLNIKGIEFFPRIKYSDSFIFATWWCNPLILLTKIILSNRIQSLKYLRSNTYWAAQIKGFENWSCGKNSIPALFLSTVYRSQLTAILFFHPPLPFCEVDFNNSNLKRFCWNVGVACWL